METELIIHLSIGFIFLILHTIILFSSKNKYSNLIRLLYILVIGIIGIFLFQSESNMLILYALFFPFVVAGFSIISFIICFISYKKTKNSKQLMIDAFVTLIMILPSLLVFFSLLNSKIGKIGG